MKLAKFWGIWVPLAAALLLSFQNCSPTGSGGSEDVQKNCTDEGCIEDTPGTRTCSFNGLEIRHGEAVDAYLDSAAANCRHERRVCDDGNLSGSYQFPTCSVSSDAKKACLFDGKAVAHGGSVQAYLASSVESGETCSRQTRTCNDGVLSGSYTFPSCSVNAPASCTFDGRTIAHGASVRAFLHSSSSSSQTLCNVSQNRVCNNGSLSGSYNFSSCTVNQPRSCSFDGRTIPHQGSVRAYLHSSSPFGQTLCNSFQSRACNDGSLSGTYEYSSCTVDTPRACTFNGRTIAHGGTVEAFQHSSAPFGSSNCNTKQTRRCSNGVLSGSYVYASCQVATPQSCLFNGRTIAHGGTVTGYRSSTGVRGTNNACQPVTRTCNNGNLSNTGAQYASCTLSNPQSCLFKGRTIPHGGSVSAYAKANNGGVGKCTPQNRVCNNGVLSGTATFETCIHTCRYGNFNINENQVILYRMDGARGECSDNPVSNNCRVAQPALQIGSFVDGKTVWGGYLAGLTCSKDGNGKVTSYRILVKNSPEGMCGNPMMSTPIRLNTLTSPYGGQPGLSALLISDVDRSNSRLLWSKPYRLKGPLPK